MTNLPITTAVPQPATSAKPAANGAENNDNAASQPFGAVLARQTQEPEAKSVKTGSKLAADVFAQLGANATDARDVSLAADGAGTLPTDMLAALLPQAMQQQTASTGSKTAGSEELLGGKPGTASLAAEARIQVGAAAKGMGEVKLDIQPKGSSFATALTGRDMGAAADTDLNIVAAGQNQPAALPSNIAALASLQTAPAPVAQTVRMTIDAPVTQSNWGDEFGQKITWLASSSQDQSAELHLNPPQLGPLDVVIKVSGDQATALFTSPHAAVRDAVEQALPKLRDMLADSGIMLGNATVSDQAPRDQGDSRPQQASTSGRDDTRDVPAVSAGTLRVSSIARHNGIVDTFA